jgi:hypothetical protein
MSIGVVVGAIGGANGSVGEIFLNNCVVYQWNVAGVQVNSGQKIVITGGRYGSNAFDEDSTGGGISIAGTAADITISGADLTPKLTNPVFPTQAYAISVTAAVNGLYVLGCSMTGYATPPGPLHLSSPGTQIEITNCAGYNDLGTVVSSTAPPTTTHFNGAYSGFSTPYFGPVTFYTKNGSGATISHIKLNSTDTNLQSGTFRIAPPGEGSYAEIDYTGLGGDTPLFLMVGE